MWQDFLPMSAHEPANMLIVRQYNLVLNRYQAYIESGGNISLPEALAVGAQICASVLEWAMHPDIETWKNVRMEILLAAMTALYDPSDPDELRYDYFMCLLFHLEKPSN